MKMVFKFIFISVNTMYNKYFKYFKRIFLMLLLSSVLCITIGCGSVNQEKANTFKIVTTIFPEYDWVRELTHNVSGCEVSLLLNNGIDMHNYQPTADDIIEISSADIFIYAGGESDAWINEIIERNSDRNMITINLLEVLGQKVKEEEMIEGMEKEEESGEESEADEHVWLSLKNAQDICLQIKNALISQDPENESIYEENYNRYLQELQDLDKKFTIELENVPNNTLIFADRFPFRYLFDDYNLKYYAAFPGCSAESEASFETVIYLSKKADEIGLKSLLVLENSDTTLSDTIIANCKNKNMQTLSINSLQSVTENDINEGITYLSSMNDNLDVLLMALDY